MKGWWDFHSQSHICDICKKKQKTKQDNFWPKCIMEHYNFKCHKLYNDLKKKLTSASLKITVGASTLFFLAASLTMASASFTLPWVISHRGDSGMNLHKQFKFTMKVSKTGCFLSYLLNHGCGLWKHYVHAQNFSLKISKYLWETYHHSGM